MQTLRYPILRSIQGENAQYLVKWFFQTQEGRTILIDVESNEFVKLLFVFDTFDEVMESRIVFQEGIDISCLDFLQTVDPLLDVPTDQFLLTFQVPADVMRELVVTDLCACEDSTLDVSDNSF